MANYNFKQDVLLGEEGEMVILNDLITMGATYDSNNKTNTHDIIVNFKGKNIHYECKTDFFDDTGNMFIETSCRGKASGIEVTKADWFVTYFKKLNEVWYIKTNRLKQILNEHTHRKTTQCGDDGSNTEGVLLNKNQFRDDFIVRDPIKHVEIIRKWQKKYQRKQNSKSN
jgi:hypothetical protein